MLKATLMIGRNRDALSVKEKAWVICDDYLKTLKDSLGEKESNIIFQAPEDKFKFKRVEVSGRWISVQCKEVISNNLGCSEWP